MPKLSGILLLAVLIIMTACSDSKDSAADITIPPSGENDECCSPAEELVMQQLLANYKELTGVSGIGVGHYTLKVYAKRSELKVEHSELLFTVEKTENGQHVKDFQLSGLSPVMSMGAMNMKHSAPTAEDFQQVNNLPIYRTWIAPLMASDEQSFWELSFKYVIKGTAGTADNLRFNVTPQTAGQNWIKSFKKEGRTYYLTLVGGDELKTGANTLRAYVTRTEDDKTLPYHPAPETFTIDIVPTMPDMGNHSSFGNTPLQKTDSGIYEGQLNLSMTGLWNIHLVVKTSDGTIVAGADTDNSGQSDLYWSVTI